jgi:hypothetical protein
MQPCDGYELCENAATALAKRKKFVIAMGLERKECQANRKMTKKRT